MRSAQVRPFHASVPAHRSMVLRASCVGSSAAEMIFTVRSKFRATRPRLRDPASVPRALARTTRKDRRVRLLGAVDPRVIYWASLLILTWISGARKSSPEGTKVAMLVALREYARLLPLVWCWQRWTRRSEKERPSPLVEGGTLFLGGRGPVCRGDIAVN